MKTLFFIAALTGAVYLIMQTPAGKSWLQESEPEQTLKQDIQQKTQPINKQILQSIENKVIELAQRLSQEQQAQIKQLENRMAELENELIMRRVAENQQLQVKQDLSRSNVTLNAYKRAEEKIVTSPFKQDLKKGFKIETQTAHKLSVNQLQRKRQAKLQDIAEKMEMSSLQVLVN